MSELSGNALVTGGSRGIGRSCALALARGGADVSITYVENAEAAEKTADEIRALGRRAHVQQLDVADADACAAAVDAAVAELGPLTYLVSNAANGTFATVEDMTIEEWDSTMAAHPRALFALAKQAAKSMKENGGGAIVAISSLGTQRAFDAYAAFGSGKAAIEVLVKYIAVELGPSNIRCNCVSGGVVLTDLFKAIPDWESIAEVSAERAPLRTVMDPDDIADAVAFFCSDGGKRITGQTLVVDGGSLLPG